MRPRPPLPDLSQRPRNLSCYYFIQKSLNMAEKATDHGHIEKAEERSHLDLGSLDVGEQEKQINDVLAAEHVMAQFDEHETRRVLKKIDRRLVPLLAVLYL
jgi:hypothetical protein